MKNVISNNKRIIRNILIILSITILLEIFVFNFNALKFNDKVNQYKEYNKTDFVLEAIDNVDNNYTTLAENYSSIEIKDINMPVQSIHINLESEDKELPIKIEYSDEVFGGYARAADEFNRYATIYSENERSKYIQCNFNGKVNSIKITFIQEDTYKINSIELNKKIPFEFNLARVSMVFFISSGIYLMFSLNIFKKDYDAKNKIQRNILIYTFVIFSIVLIFIGYNVKKENRMFAPYKEGNDLTVYHKFVEAIVIGTTELNYTVSPELKNMENPYDYSARNEQKVDFVWDSAYYNGKYYSYFGIVPALIAYVPFFNITGAHLSHVLATFIFLFIGSIFNFVLLKELISRYIKDVKFNIMILMMLSVMFTNKILWVMARPEMYEAVIAAAYMFIMMGMYYFIKYLNTNKNKYVVMFCSALALAVACRPDTLLCSIIVIPTLLKRIIANFKSKNIKENIQLIILAGIPYAIVGISLMILNYVRFGSIFEFGANYQLTVTNISEMGYRFATIPIGILSYLFGSINIQPKFPFVFSNEVIPQYMSYYFQAKIGGGIFVTNIFAYVLLGLPIIYKYLKDNNKEMFRYIYVLLITGFILLLNTAMLGNNEGRYMLNFAWMFNIPIMLLILLVYKTIENEMHKKLIEIFITIAVIFTIFTSSMLALQGEDDLMRKLNGEQYYNVKNVFTFWE